MEGARYELYRALDFGNEADLATWARRWGAGLVASAEARAEAVDAFENSLPY